MAAVKTSIETAATVMTTITPYEANGQAPGEVSVSAERLEDSADHAADTVNDRFADALSHLADAA